MQTDFQQSNPDMTTATQTFTNLTPGTEYNIEIIQGAGNNPVVRTAVQRCSKFFFLFEIECNFEIIQRTNDKILVSNGAFILYSCSPCRDSKKLYPVHESGRDGRLQLGII